MDWFKFRLVWGVGVRLLSDEEAGRLLKALITFARSGRKPCLEGREGEVLQEIAIDLREDIRQFRAAAEKTEEIREKRKTAGLKGAANRWQQSADGSPKNAAEMATDSKTWQNAPKNKNKKENKNTEKESEKEKEKEKDPDAEEEFFNCCPEPSPEDSGPPAAEIPLNDHTVYPVSREEMETFAKLYPAVDVPQALRNIQAWCMSNPERRKTRRGVMRFINTWLAREQNRGRPGGSPGHRVPVNPFLEELKKMEQQDPEAQAPGFIFYGGEEIS